MAMNNVNLIGRLTKDVELKKTSTGLSTCTFSLAVDKTMSKADRQKAEAEGRPTADFISCVAWRQSADILAQYAKKGMQIGVAGRIQTRSYQNNAGQTVYVTEVVCDNIQLLDRPAQATQAVPVAPAAAAQPVPVQPAPAPVAAPVYNEPAPQAPVQMEEPVVTLEITSDDLPFY